MKTSIKIWNNFLQFVYRYVIIHPFLINYPVSGRGWYSLSRYVTNPCSMLCLFTFMLYIGYSRRSHSLLTSSLLSRIITFETLILIGSSGTIITRWNIFIQSPYCVIFYVETNSQTNDKIFWDVLSWVTFVKGSAYDSVAKQSPKKHVDGYIVWCYLKTTPSVYQRLWITFPFMVSFFKATQPWNASVLSM